jgi:hypothetical protein
MYSYCYVMYSYCYVMYSYCYMFHSGWSVSLCRSMYCLCVNVYCTTATGCQPSYSWQIYHIIYHISCIIISYIISCHIISCIISYHTPKLAVQLESTKFRILILYVTDSEVDKIWHLEKFTPAATGIKMLLVTWLFVVTFWRAWGMNTANCVCYSISRRVASPGHIFFSGRCRSSDAIAWPCFTWHLYAERGNIWAFPWCRRLARWDFMIGVCKRSIIQESC